MAERLSQGDVEELVAAHPEMLLLRDSDDAYQRLLTEFKCGSGWKNLIDSMLTSIQRHIDYTNRYTDMPIDQIKIQNIIEKAGSLRVYYTGANDIVDAMISVTSEISKTICEISGAAGTTYAKDGWFKTLSPELATMLGYELDQRLSDSELGAGTDATGT